MYKRRHWFTLPFSFLLPFPQQIVIARAAREDQHCHRSTLEEADDCFMLLQSSISLESPNRAGSEILLPQETQRPAQQSFDDDFTSDKENSSTKNIHGSIFHPGYNHDTEGGSDKTNAWLKDAGRNHKAVFLATTFVLLIASLPIILHCAGRGGVPTRIVIIEAAILFIWLIGGLYLYTRVLLFQSPHFGREIRTLTLVEAVYLFAQILTTVGYGDITPARARGQLFVGFHVLFGFLLVANMLWAFMKHLDRLVSGDTARDSKTSSGDTSKKEDQPKGPSFTPVLWSLASYGSCVLAGAIFFHSYPGEDKTIFQAVYMSTITLSTVGFGAFTPVTEVGMAFGTFWMVFGVAALASVLGSFTAYMHERKLFEAGYGKTKSVDAGDILRGEYADRYGHVDHFGYLRYHLLKNNLMTKDEIDRVTQRFEIFDVERTGLLRADVIIHMDTT